jgi:predicted MFS family arabinose efflux permease
LDTTLTTTDLSKPQFGRVFWLALGNFAIGTVGFMIAGLLPVLAADLEVSIETAGQLVSIYALSYAITSPILTTFTGHLDRRKVLIGSMLAFILANIFAFQAADYWWLSGALVLLALSAGLYVPNANALALAFVPPQRRGLALSIVNGGTTLSLIFGVPLGAIIGQNFGWHLAFAGVAALAMVAAMGLVLGLPQTVGRQGPVVTLRERATVIARPDILIVLLVTMLWSAGGFSIYTYLAPYLMTATDMAETNVSIVFFTWGIAAAIGVFSGGALSDRLGSGVMGSMTLAVLVATFSALSILAFAVPPALAVTPVLVTIVIWGITGWAFYPSHLSRLVQNSGPALAPVALSLNASFLNFGISIGSMLGSITLSRSSAVHLGWVGALCEVMALVLLLGALRRA